MMNLKDKTKSIVLVESKLSESSILAVKLKAEPFILDADMCDYGHLHKLLYKFLTAVCFIMLESTKHTSCLHRLSNFISLIFNKKLYILTHLWLLFYRRNRLFSFSQKLVHSF